MLGGEQIVISISKQECHTVIPQLCGKGRIIILGGFSLRHVERARFKTLKAIKASRFSGLQQPSLGIEGEEAIPGGKATQLRSNTRDPLPGPLPPIPLAGPSGLTREGNRRRRRRRREEDGRNNSLLEKLPDAMTQGNGELDRREKERCNDPQMINGQQNAASSGEVAGQG